MPASFDSVGYLFAIGARGPFAMFGLFVTMMKVEVWNGRETREKGHREINI